MDSKLEKWIKWLGVIEKEIQWLLINMDIFLEVNSMIRDNKDIQKSDAFHRYLGDTYVAYALMGIRRQIKVDDQSISFARLLSEIAESPEILSREYYTGLYKGKVVERFADRDFDRYIGQSKDHICPEAVKKDLEKLRQTAIKCEEFADRRIAHTDKRDVQSPVFKDADDCIDLLDKLGVKYIGIFHGASMQSLMPTYQYDWQEIFRYPWLKDDSVIVPNESGEKAH